DYLAGLKEGLGEKARTMVVGEAAYQISDPTIDSQMVTLKATGATVFFNASTPKFAAQAIRKAAELGWKPVHILNVGISSVAAVLQPAGFENAVGVISATYYKDPTDPKWQNDPGYLAWITWMKKIHGHNMDRGSRVRRSRNQPADFPGSRWPSGTRRCSR